MRLHAMPTENSAGVLDVRRCSGLSASHDCKAKTTATLRERQECVGSRECEGGLPADHSVRVTRRQKVWGIRSHIGCIGLLVPSKDLRHWISCATVRIGGQNSRQPLAVCSPWYLGGCSSVDSCAGHHRRHTAHVGVRLVFRRLRIRHNCERQQHVTGVVQRLCSERRPTATY